MTRQFTGWHITAILTGFFLVVVSVNFLMASLAVSGFGGVVVENSYVASQHFNRWLAEARAGDATGWEARVRRDGEGRLLVAVDKAPRDLRVEAELRHPLGRGGGYRWHLAPDGEGRFVSPESLPEGRWLVRATLRGGGHEVKLERPVG